MKIYRDADGNLTVDKAEAADEWIDDVPAFTVTSSDMGYVAQFDSWYDEQEYPGWYSEIVKLEKDIERILSEIPDSWFHVDQMKEKWGELVIYFQASSNIYDLVNGLISRACNKTQFMCRECGAPATHRSSPTGWIEPYCEECAHRVHDAKNARHKTEVPFEKGFEPIIIPVIT